MILFDEHEITEGTLQFIDDVQADNPIAHVIATAIVSAGEVNLHRGEKGDRVLFVPVFLEGEAAADFQAIEDEHGFLDAVGAMENGLNIAGTSASCGCS